MHLRPGAMILAAFAVVVATAAPAIADTVSFTDQREDAPAGYDLTRTTITNGQDQLEVVQQVRALRGGATQIYGFNVFVGQDQYIVHVVRRSSGTVFTRFTSSAGEAECDIAVRWRIARNSIRVSLPRNCIVEDGAFRARTMIGSGDGTSGDPVDWTKQVRVGQD